MAYPTNDMLNNTPLGMYFQGQSIGDEQRLNREKSEAHGLKYLMDQMTAGNDLSKSDLEGTIARAKMGNPEYIPSQLAGDIARWQSEGFDRDFKRDTLPGRTEFTNKDNAQKVLELLGKGYFTRAQNDALAGVGSGQPTGDGQIGFSMAPETPKGPTPSALFATMQRLESGGQRYGKDGKLLTSPKGALGENQVMPATIKDPGFGVTPARDESPDEIARVGREYLDKMYQRYQNPELALAAYNAGPGALDKILAKAQKAGVDWRTILPQETQEYLRKSGYAGTETPQNVIAPFAKAASDTPWSSQMNPQSKVGQMAAILGMSPEYAKSAALQEQRGQDSLEATRLRAEASKKFNDPKYKEQLMHAFKVMADPKATEFEKYEAQTVIHYDQQARLAGAPGAYKPQGIDMAQYGIQMNPSAVQQNPAPKPPGGQQKADPLGIR